MKIGLKFCFLSPISFGTLGCISKVAERKKCNASALVLSLMGWSTLIMLVRSASLHSGFQIPFRAVAVAFGFGIVGAVAFFAFQKSIEIGKVTALKLVAFALALLALLLLFWGRIIEEQSARKP